VSPPIAQTHIIPSFLQNLPGAVKHYRHYLPLMPLAIRSFRLAGYDLVLSSSHAVAKGVRIAGDTPHLCYLYTPMRYMWDGFADYFGPGRARWPVRVAARGLRPLMRAWDARTARGVHRFLAISRAVQGRIRRHYGRESTVIYPPVSLERFGPPVGRGDFYLMVGAFAPNKRVDDAILAFNRLARPLVIVGAGQDEARCRALAGPTVTFLGERDDREIADLYRRARAFVFPGEDDFGITPVEAQASGTPVIALAAGGALETVTDATGLLYSPAGPDALAEAVTRFEVRREHFRPEACVANAQRFGRERFKREIAAAIEETLAEYGRGGVAALRRRW
jgi:glycosyltransferase involved in cell wall biosynthesis